MSLVHSISIDSSSSTTTMATVPPADLPIDSSNNLYENRDHFQAIFTNDSRFFDTSLHLFKSYCELGYIEADEKKHRKLHFPHLLSTSQGRKHRWRPRLLGSNTTDTPTDTLRAFLTPTLFRKSADPSTSIRSDSGISSNEPISRQQNSPMIVRYQHTSVPTINITENEQFFESDVTITRL